MGDCRKNLYDDDDDDDDDTLSLPVLVLHLFLGMVSFTGKLKLP